MLSIYECKKILNKKNNNYTTEQTKAIRDYLYQMAMVIDELKPKRNE